MRVLAMEEWCDVLFSNVADDFLANHPGSETDVFMLYVMSASDTNSGVQ